MINKRKMVKIITGISLIGTVVLALRNLLIPIFTLFFIHKEVLKDSSAIGIIGAADGPTSIIVSSNNRFGIDTIDILTIAFAVITFLGILYLVITKGKTKNDV